jgi:iron complex outermembrane receptor protein
MKTYLFLLVALVSCNTVHAQNTFRAIIKDAGTREALAGATATVVGTRDGAVADAGGLVVIKNIPDGRHEIAFSFTGYERHARVFTFPLEGEATVLLESRAGELDEVVVSSTRGTRTFRDIPTRIEFIGGEELEEKGNMRPGDIRMILNESTGIQTQQTSPLSANASIRIQGLDGRYTQVLKDGFPLYAGAASGLGLLQVAPLDLKQVEIIKGSSSTLHGGGAIAGMVNLITRTPASEPELSFHLSGTSAAGLDLSGFYSRRFKHAGVTLFVVRNSNAAYDPAGIDLSAIPAFERYTVNPRLLLYFNGKTTLDAGVNVTIERRAGGDMHYLAGNREEGYFERNRTRRVSTRLSLEHASGKRSRWVFRDSYSYFHRVISLPGYTFDGRQEATFAEIHHVYTGEASEWVAGANLWTERFTEKRHAGEPPRDYRQVTGGLFVQHTARVTPWLGIESGLRGDIAAGHAPVLLPRVSALFTISRRLSSRAGGGFGYKTPGMFTEESERVHYRGVLPVDNGRDRLERARGASVDVDYRVAAGGGGFLSINQLLFYTHLDSPLRLTPLPDGTSQFRNIDGHVATRGAETNAKFRWHDFTLFTGYTFTDAAITEAGTRHRAPLTSRHRLNNVLVYELEDSWKVGLEAYYYSPQRLEEGTTGRDYWIFGAMVEKIWEHLSVYANFENFTDTRQTRFGSIYTGTLAAPRFKEIYAPLDGFIASVGIKIRL